MKVGISSRQEEIGTARDGLVACGKLKNPQVQSFVATLRPGSEIHPKRFRVLVPEPLLRTVKMFEIVSPERFRFFNDGPPIHGAMMPLNLRRTENRKVKRLKKLPLHFQKDSIRLSAFSPP